MAKKTKINIGIARLRGRGDAEIGFLVERYLERHPECFADDGAIDIEAILEWAFTQRSYTPPPIDPRTQLRRRIRRHFGHRYITTHSGRQARALVAVPRERITQDGVSKTFRYYPLLETEAPIIRSGLSLRRNWAYKRVEQIENDRLAYNEGNIFGQTIDQMSFDFDARLKRAAMPTNYPKSAPANVDPEDDR